MNRKYKDTLFVMLFSNERLLRELYNALAGTNFGEETPIVINTLKNVLFMDRCNDISFIIGNRLVVLIEHQSTINPNMPLRFLLYIAGVYEKLIDKKAIYRKGSTPIPLPSVEFYVVYNGVDPLPDCSEIKLSDAFIGEESQGINLELVVKVLNINYGHNQAILDRSETLGMYAEFVEMVRRKMKVGMGKEEKRETLKKVVEESIGKGILKEFLEANGGEVQNMLYSKWDWNEYMEVKREEAAAEFVEHERQYQEQIQQAQEQIQWFQEQNRQVWEHVRQLEEENRRLRNGGVSG